MRVVIVMLAVLVLAAVLASGPSPPGREGEESARNDASPKRETPGIAARSLPARKAPSPATPPRLAASMAGARAAAIPPSLGTPAPIELPAALELVSLPAVPGAKAAPPRTISRAEAIASVIGSREFQDTITPLARLYLAAFGRYPDYEGINYYTGQREEARPLHEIAEEFTRSREFEQRHGPLDDAQFVELIFTNVLGHPSQADVRAYWVNEIATGRMTRGQVLVDLAESGAFRERSAHQVFVSSAYLEILRRTPDPAGYDYWVAQLHAGQPYRSVINGLLAGR